MRNRRLRTCIKRLRVGISSLYQLWEDVHATVRKCMSWKVPSRVPSIDTDFEYAKGLSCRAERPTTRFPTTSEAPSSQHPLSSVLI